MRIGEGELLLVLVHPRDVVSEHLVVAHVTAGGKYDALVGKNLDIRLVSQVLGNDTHNLVAILYKLAGRRVKDALRTGLLCLGPVSFHNRALTSCLVG